MVTQADLDWWLAKAPDLAWKTADSMPDAPHSYVVRGKTLAEADFLRAVKVIRTFGQPGKFWAMTNIYLSVGGLKWWTMGDTLDGTVIINMATTARTYGRQDAPRTRSGLWSVYDEIAPDYDARYHKPSDEAENEHLADLCRTVFGSVAPRTLDVGCGTGLLLDLAVTAPGMYTGVDPSQAMLNELVRKHPRVRNITAARMEDVVDSFGPGQFELVAAWFGVASYLPGHVVKALPSLATRLAVLMHYREGYLPDYYSGHETPEHLAESLDAARQIDASRRYLLNNFEVTVVAHGPA
jgi:SAM-dependent methyltransferase